MSQHLIIDFINRAYTFKPINGATITTDKVKKYQASNRKNNSSPADVEESIHHLQQLKKSKQATTQEKPEGDEKHIDISI